LVFKGHCMPFVEGTMLLGLVLISLPHPPNMRAGGGTWAGAH